MFKTKLTTLLPTVFQNPKQHSTISTSLINLCKNLKQLKQSHAKFILQGLLNPKLTSQLINSYSNLGHPELSLHLFNSVKHLKSCDLYNAMMSCFNKVGDFKNTILVFKDMVNSCVCIDEESVCLVLNAKKDGEFGNMVFGYFLKLGFVGVDNLVDGLAVGDGIVDAVRLFRLSVEMGLVGLGRSVHCFVVVRGLCEDVSVSTAGLSMYSKLGCLEDARLLFERMESKDCVVWNVMIMGYSRNGQPMECLELLRTMVKSGVRDDLFTAIAAVSSVVQLKSVEWGKQMHSRVLRNGCDYQVSVCNSLIDMYCECDHLQYAQRIFDLLRDKTVITWSSLIKGYISHKCYLEALSLFSEMRRDGTKADFVTIINVLPACVNVGALAQVKYLHGYSIKLGLNLLSSVNTALFVSYAKCGCIEMAQKLFDEENINSKDVITWNSMINANAKHGDWSRCFLLYNRMKHLNLRPDQVTFLGLLTACVNSGLVKEGQQCYKEMVESYGIQPSQEHYACMVDLLGRAGDIEEARDLINSMPFKPDARVWGPLLSACKLHSKAELAEFAAEKLIELEPNNAGNYVLLSNIYAAAGNWKGVARMRGFLKDKGLKKTPGCSWLEINGHLHEFRIADQSHPRASIVYGILEILEFEVIEARNKLKILS